MVLVQHHISNYKKKHVKATQFINALEIIFAMSNLNIKGLNILDHNYLYTA